MRMDADELRTTAMGHEHRGKVRLSTWSQKDGRWLAHLGCADRDWAASGEYPPDTFSDDLELWDVFLR